MNNANDKQRAARELAGLLELTRQQHPATRWRQPWRPASGAVGMGLIGPKASFTLDRIIAERRRGLNYKQIARALTLSEGSINSLVYRARKCGRWPDDLALGKLPKGGEP